MLEPIDIIGHLREQEFDEHELLLLLGQMIQEQRTESADKAILQYTKSLSAFRSRRLRRLISEFRNIILTDINDTRRQTKWELAQKLYRENRKNKKDEKKRPRIVK